MMGVCGKKPTGRAFFMLLAVWWLSPAMARAEPEQSPPDTAPEAERVVIPFDFESKFDGGRYGQIVGDMIWKKLQRQGRFVIPESMLDVRDWCERNRQVPGPETSRKEMRRIIRDEFGAQIGIWGKVELAEGAETDIYDLWIYVADFSTQPETMIYEAQARTKTVSEIPHVFFKEAFDRLYGRGKAPTAPPDLAAERLWQEGPNLVVGDFQLGSPPPRGWEKLPQYVTLAAEDGGASEKNRFLRFSFPSSVAETSGVLYYSDYFPVVEGAKYRFQCRWRTDGPAAKVFIKCYDELPSKYSRGKEMTSTQRREVYRSQQNLKGPAGEWNVQTEDFTPKHTQYQPRWGRVMLYAYYPAGTVDWDDVVVKQIVPPPAGAPKKVRRPSSETKVRTEEIK